jgi:hypothetical protein
LTFIASNSRSWLGSPTFWAMSRNRRSNTDAS